MMLRKIFGLLNLEPQQKKNLIFPLLFFLLIPPAVCIVLGIMYQNPVVGHVPTAILDRDNSNLSNTLDNEIRANENFNIVYYSESEQEIENLLKTGQAAAGFVIPENFAQDLLSGKAPRVLALYDGSQLSMVGAAKGKFTEILATIRAGYLLNVMEAKAGIMPEVARDYLQPIDFTTRFLGNPTKNYIDFIVQGVLINIIQVGLAIVALEIGPSKSSLLSP